MQRTQLVTFGVPQGVSGCSWAVFCSSLTWAWKRALCRRKKKPIRRAVLVKSWSAHGPLLILFCSSETKLRKWKNQKKQKTLKWASVRVRNMTALAWPCAAAQLPAAVIATCTGLGACPAPWPFSAHHAGTALCDTSPPSLDYLRKRKKVQVADWLIFLQVFLPSIAFIWNM